MPVARNDQDKVDDAEPTCFVICPIGEPTSPQRVRSGKIARHIIEPVMREYGFRVLNASQIATPGLITHQIMAHIENAELVVADLSESNPNVFYELSLRHVLRLPVIQIIEGSDRVPFDVGDVRTIRFDITDLDSVAEARVALSEQVAAILAGRFVPESPISRALNLEQLRNSGNPEQASIAAIADQMTALQTQMSRLNRQMAGQPRMSSLLTDDVQSAGERAWLDRTIKRVTNNMFSDETLRELSIVTERALSESHVRQPEPEWRPRPEPSTE